MASSQLQTLRSVMLALAAVQLVTAASATLVSLYFAETGASQTTAAMASAMYNGGFLIGCFYAAGPISSIGYIRAFSAAAAISAASALLFSLTELVPALLVVRMMTGVATAGLFAIGDSWINESSSNASRGRLLSIYAVAMGLMSVASQLVIMFAPEDLNKSFVLVSLLYCFAIVVIAAARTDPPEIKSKAVVRIRGLFKESPSAFTGSFVVGAVQTSILSIVPFRFSMLGLTATTISVVIGSIYLGRILFQFNLGKFSDKVDRRLVILGSASVASVLLFGMSFLGNGDGKFMLEIVERYGYAPIIVNSLLLGGSLLTMYSLLVAHALDRTPPVYVSANAVTMLFTYTVGCVAGPLLVSLLSEFWGDGVLGWFSFGLMAAYTSLLVYRIKTVAPAERAEKVARVAVNQNSVELTPKAKRKESPTAEKIENETEGEEV